MIQKALEALKNGGMVLVFDAGDRERETDMVMAAQYVEPEHIAKMRKDAGGLICLAVHPIIADRLRLPFLTEIFNMAGEHYSVLEDLAPNDIPYDEQSAFSLTINYRGTFTGITDKDRSMTIQEFAKLSDKVLNGYGREEFGRKFRSPGHVPLLRGANNLLKERKGHTELSVALAEMAGLIPVTTICEMLNDKTGLSMNKKEAAAYAEKNDLVFLEGKSIVKAYLKSLTKRTP